MSAENLPWAQVAVSAAAVSIAAAVTGKRHKVLRAIVPASAALNFYFRSGVTTQIGPTFYMAASTTLVLKEEDLGFIATEGEALYMVFSAGTGKAAVKLDVLNSGA